MKESEFPIWASWRELFDDLVDPPTGVGLALIEHEDQTTTEITCSGRKVTIRGQDNLKKGYTLEDFRDLALAKGWLKKTSELTALPVFDCIEQFIDALEALDGRFFHIWDGGGLSTCVCYTPEEDHFQVTERNHRYQKLQAGPFHELAIKRGWINA